MNWEVILWTCITVAVLIGLGTLVISIISARNMRKSRDRMAQLQGEIKVGARVLFGGGIYGTITGIQDDIIRVEVSKGVVLEISRYSIQTVA
ncbi:MAG: preprotein translocase subunit YajC [Agathobaculum sp.]|uniref:preprotein translocase subunit YajC n=1 Tax=Agathobaculum sp. TaxID=2048138 RepID=UPI0025C63018|nr:preprotein translocase subunit YajC [Agathobaculum sp.]MCI7125425.1 preprotein translocase subunit YajC [Agathobaculum sp.]MDY3711827.1 preprotein translocase subunit YajC [Agathobaculum sp.]